MKPLRLVPLAAAFALAACSAAPTEPALSAGAGPRFDGPNTIGSGNRNDDGGGTATQGSFDGASTASDSTGVPSLGPNTIGSGN